LTACLRATPDAFEAQDFDCRCPAKRPAFYRVAARGHARTGPTMPLSSCALKSWKLKQIADELAGALRNDHATGLRNALQASRKGSASRLLWLAPEKRARLSLGSEKCEAM